MARKTRKTSKPNDRKSGKRKGNKNKKSMKKQKGGGLGEENAELEKAFDMKDHFSDSFKSIFRWTKIQMSEKKIDVLVKLFTVGIEYDWGRIKPSLDTTFPMSIHGPIYNTMQYLIAEYPQFVASFIDGLKEAGVDVSTQFFNEKYFIWDSPKAPEVQYFIWKYLRVACEFLPDDANINLIETLIERYETYNGKGSIKGIINKEFPNIHINENCFLTLINVHNADKQDRVIKAMKLLIHYGADEKYETERSAGVTGWLARIGNALTKAKELNAEQETRGMFKKVINFLKAPKSEGGLGLEDPQEEMKDIRLGKGTVFTGV